MDTPAEPHRPLRWRLRAGARLRWRRWGDEHVVFDAATAATHLLPPGPAALLHRLEAGPTDQATLAALIGADADPGALDALLARLRRLDLVEPVRA